MSKLKKSIIAGSALLGLVAAPMAQAATDCDQHRDQNRDRDGHYRWDDRRDSRYGWQNRRQDWRRFDRNRYERQERAFAGKIIAVSNDSFTLRTQQNGVQMVSLNQNTQIRKNGHSANYSDLNRGTRVVVRGSWDRTDRDISATLITIVR